MIDTIPFPLAVYGISAVTLVGYVVWYLLDTKKRSCRSIPGPQGLPVVGNLWQVDDKDRIPLYRKWAAEYGPIFSVKFGTKNVVVLNKDKHVRELFDKRSGIYSDRPENYMIGEVASQNMRLGFMHYGQQWRAIRKIFHAALNVGSTRKYESYMKLEAQKLMYDLLEDPEQFASHIQRFTNSVIISIVYGRRASRHDDPEVTEVFNNFRDLSVYLSRGLLLDYFPILRRLPDQIMSVRRFGKQLFNQDRNAFLSRYQRCKQEYSENTIKPCFAQAMIEQQKSVQINDERAAFSCGSLLNAGSDTTANTLIAFIAAMACFPEVQRKAREEINRVVSHDRMPNGNDDVHLPYVRQCIQEVLRWMPTVALGLEHATTSDDTFEGHFIPAGTTIVCNTWTIHNDPEAYPEPREFRPERWDGKLQTAKDNSVGARTSLVGFGGGRRICPGQHVAERNLSTAITHMLWAFEISKAVDDNGNEIHIDTDTLTPGGATTFLPFHCSIQPHSAHHSGLVRKEWHTAREKLLDENEQWVSVPEEIQSIFRKV